MHGFIYCLYVSYCSVTNISRTILHVVLRKILYLLFLHPKKKELRMSYYNTRFAIASNSGRWHPVLHIVTVASTIMSVQKSNGISIIHVGISMSNQPPPPFFFLFRRIRFSSIHSLGILFKSKIRHARK